MAVVVPLLFTRHLSLNVARNILAHLQRQNVVMHVVFRKWPHRMTVRSAIRRRRYMPHGTTDPVMRAAATDPSSPFEHNKFNLGRYGKILQFHRNKNLIRAGKHTHCDALYSTIRFIQWTRTSDWFVQLTAPNAVVSGKFAATLCSTVKDHPASTHSAKFPGIAIKLNSTRCTPELYLKSGSFIVPGISTTNDLKTTVEDLVQSLTRHNHLVAAEDAPPSE